MCGWRTTAFSQLVQLTRACPDDVTSFLKFITFFWVETPAL